MWQFMNFDSFLLMKIISFCSLIIFRICRRRYSLSFLPLNRTSFNSSCMSRLHSKAFLNIILFISARINCLWNCLQKNSIFPGLGDWIQMILFLTYQGDILCTLFFINDFNIIVIYHIFFFNVITFFWVFIVNIFKFIISYYDIFHFRWPNSQLNPIRCFRWLAAHWLSLMFFTTTSITSIFQISINWILHVI